MLAISVVVFLLVAVTVAAVLAGFSWRSLFLSAAVAEVLGLALLGLPGGAFLEVVEPIMRGIGRPPIAADAAWPAAIMMSVVWPVALAPAYYVARAVRVGRGPRGLVALAVLSLTCLLVSVLVHALVA